MERKKATENLTPRFIATAVDREIYGLGLTKQEAIEDFDNKVNATYNYAGGGKKNLDRGRTLMNAVRVEPLTKPE